MKIFRIILCVLLLAAAVLAPPYLVKMARRDFFASLFEREKPAFSGTVVLYHVASKRTMAGSVTAWLNAQAEAYEKKHRGTFVLIEGMTEEQFAKRIAYGRTADGYSFFSGALYPELFQPIGIASERLREGLFDTEWAVPYLYSGYAAIEAEGGTASLPASDPIAALFDERTEKTGSVVSLYEAGRAQSGDGTYGAIGKVEPIGSYTDEVCWLGIGRACDEAHAEALRGFFRFLCDRAQQQTLGALGAFSVREDVKDAIEQSRFRPIAETYRFPKTPDPFLLYGQRDRLMLDAEAALSGDGDAERRFRERMDGILGK